MSNPEKDTGALDKNEVRSCARARVTTRSIKTADVTAEPEKRPAVEQITVRDLDRIQEKQPFTLTAVHMKIAAAAAAALLIAGLAAGWMLGRGSAPETKKVTMPEIVPDLTSANDKAEPETADKPVHREVRGSVLPAEPAIRPPESSVPGRRGPVQPEPDYTPVWFLAFVKSECAYTCLEPYCGCEKEPVPETKPEPVPAPEPIEKPAAEPEPKPVPEPKPAAEPEPIEKPAVKPKPEPRPTPEVKKTPKPVRKPAARPTRQFSVQVRSFKEKSMAREFAQTLRAKGYNTFVVTYIDPAGRTWYRVRTGRFDTAAEASAFAAELNAKESEESIPVEAK